MTHPLPPVARAPRGHVPALDGLRGVAVLLTMLLHFSQPFYGVLQRATPLDRLYQRVADAGWVGVDLFFVLSGFLITGILYDSKGGEGYFRNFYMRRALRILPLYYAFLVLRLLVWPALAPGAAPVHDVWTDQLWLWAHLANVPIAAQADWGAAGAHLSHFWSLAVEEQFYLFWPLLVLRASRRTLMWVCAALIPFAAAVGVALGFALDNPIAAYVLLPARVDSLAVGALTALAIRGPGGAARLAPLAGPALLASGGVLLGLALTRGGLSLEDRAVQLAGYPALAVFFGACIVRVLTSAPGGGWTRALTRPGLRFFGRYSYALYVFHLPLAPIVARRLVDPGQVPAVYGSYLPGQLLYALVACALSVAAALVSWHLLEKHFLTLKDRFAPAPARGASAPEAAGHDGDPSAGAVGTIAR